MPDIEDHEGADVRWVSYDELASIRGIDKASAFRMAHRRRWLKRKGNDGTVRLAVPVSVLQGRTRANPDVRSDVISDDRSDLLPDNHATISALQSLIAAKDSQIEALHGWLAAEKDRAAKAEDRGDRAEDRAHRAEQRLIEELARLAGQNVGSPLQTEAAASMTKEPENSDFEEMLAELRLEFEGEGRKPLPEKLSKCASEPNQIEAPPLDAANSEPVSATSIVPLVPESRRIWWSRFVPRRRRLT
jgi:hypothetical protein